MFLSTVISRPETLRRVISAGTTDPSTADFGFLRNPRRFCVAVSRAQALNVVVRPMSSLRRGKSGGEMARGALSPRSHERPLLRARLRRSGTRWCLPTSLTGRS